MPGTAADPTTRDRRRHEEKHHRDRGDRRLGAQRGVQESEQRDPCRICEHDHQDVGSRQGQDHRRKTAVKANRHIGAERGEQTKAGRQDELHRQQDEHDDSQRRSELVGEGPGRARGAEGDQRERADDRDQVDHEPGEARE